MPSTVHFVFQRRGGALKVLYGAQVEMKFSLIPRDDQWPAAVLCEAVIRETFKYSAANALTATSRRTRHLETLALAGGAAVAYVLIGNAAIRMAAPVLPSPKYDLNGDTSHWRLPSKWNGVRSEQRPGAL